MLKQESNGYYRCALRYVGSRLVKCVIPLLLAGSVIYQPTLHAQSFLTDLSSIALAIYSDKKQYVLGEPIHLTFRIINTSQDVVTLKDDVNVFQGTLKVFISFEGGEFRQYRTLSWERLSIETDRHIFLRPGELYEHSAMMMHNSAPDVSHLNEEAADEFRKGVIDTVYLLAREGRYSIKAVFYDSETGKQIESSPIQVQAEKPQGDELGVWNVIKDDGRYAFFIQHGGIGRSLISASTVQIVTELARVSEQYPRSRFSAPIRESIVEYLEAIEALKNEGIVNDLPQFNFVSESGLSVAAYPEIAKVGDSVTYTMKVTNAGPSAAVNVVVSVIFPGLLVSSFCSATGDGVCRGEGNSREITFASIQPGAFREATLVAKVVSISSDSRPVETLLTVASDTPEVNRSNNTVRVKTTITAPPRSDSTICLQDKRNGDALQVNIATGEYKFTHCGSDGFVLTGKGRISGVGCETRLRDAYVTATINSCPWGGVKSGVATVKRTPLGPTFIIKDKNFTDSACSCR